MVYGAHHDGRAHRPGDRRHDGARRARFRLQQPPLPHLPPDQPVTSSLRTLVLGLTSVATVAVMGGGLAMDLRQRVAVAEARLAGDSERTAASTLPLLT